MSHPKYLFTYCNTALLTTRTKASTSPLSIPTEMRKKGSESSAMVELAGIREAEYPNPAPFMIGKPFLLDNYKTNSMHASSPSLLFNIPSMKSIVTKAPPWPQP
ncbi:hypothetical protein ABZX51_006184 [Aspergillus tubingensis]